MIIYGQMYRKYIEVLNGLTNAPVPERLTFGNDPKRLSGLGNSVE